MEKETKLQEQDAPLKNTDNAFVQVSEDGSPHIPESNEERSEQPGRDESPTTIERR